MVTRFPGAAAAGELRKVFLFSHVFPGRSCGEFRHLRLRSQFRLARGSDEVFDAAFSWWIGFTGNLRWIKKDSFGVRRAASASRNRSGLGLEHEMETSGASSEHYFLGHIFSRHEMNIDERWWTFAWHCLTWPWLYFCFLRYQAGRLHWFTRVAAVLKGAAAVAANASTSREIPWVIWSIQSIHPKVTQHLLNKISLTPRRSMFETRFF